MTIHIIRLAVGVRDVDHLAAIQRTRICERAGRPATATYTRRMPRRIDELLEDGSLYWVVKGVVRCRQRVLELEDATGEDGATCCRIVLDAELVAVVPTLRGAFQGWRYLEPADAPRDEPAAGDLPAEMAAQLRELGLL